MPNTAGSVNINLSKNAVTFTQGIKQAQAELDKFIEAVTARNGKN